MRISVVTISFNQAKYLEEAILSVLNQDHDDIEYIVVDPGSTDGSRQIIEKYAGDIQHVIFEKDNGPADGLNKGFEKATGDILAFLNSDDIFLPGAFRRMARAFEEQPYSDVISGHALIIDGNGKPINRLYSRPFSPRRFVYRAGVLAQQATFFRQDIFRKVGGFNPANRIAWDGELWLDFSLAGARFRLIDEFLAGFRVYGDNISGLGASYLSEVDMFFEEMFRKVNGREKTPLDKVMSRALNLGYYISHPYRLYYRLKHGNVLSS